MIGIVKSCGIVQLHNPQGGVVWATRLRLTDGQEWFAGLDNQHGKAVAETAHRNTYAIPEGRELDALPVMNHPISREQIQLCRVAGASKLNSGRHLCK